MVESNLSLDKARVLSKEAFLNIESIKEKDTAEEISIEISSIKELLSEAKEEMRKAQEKARNAVTKLRELVN